MGTFDEQKETEMVETVREVTRFEFPVIKNHMIEEEYVEEVDGEEVTKTRMVDDGGPDLDLIVYIGGDRSEHRRQVPRAKVLAGWPGNLRAELLKVINNAE